MCASLNKRIKAESSLRVGRNGAATELDTAAFVEHRRANDAKSSNEHAIFFVGVCLLRDSQKTSDECVRVVIANSLVLECVFFAESEISRAN